MASLFNVVLQRGEMGARVGSAEMISYSRTSAFAGRRLASAAMVAKRQMRAIVVRLFRQRKAKPWPGLPAQQTLVNLVERGLC